MKQFNDKNGKQVNIGDKVTWIASDSLTKQYGYVESIRVVDVPDRPIMVSVSQPHKKLNCSVLARLITKT